MRKSRIVAGLGMAGALITLGADWPMQNGGPERNGWARSEHILSKANVKGLKKLYAYRAESAAGRPGVLTTPIVNGNLITYRGFKEMLIFSGDGDRVFSVDADLNQTIWSSQLVKAEAAQAKTSATCPAASTSPVAMAGSSSAAMRFTVAASRTAAAANAPTSVNPAAPANAPIAANPTAPANAASPMNAPPSTTRRRPSPYFPPLWQSVYPMRPETLSQLAVVYAVASDGYLHIVNSSTGADLIAAVKFVPPNAKVTSLNVWENMVYATTADNCDGYRNALYGVNLLANEKHVVVFALEAGGFAGSAPTAIGRDGTVYAQALQPGARKGEYREALLALSPHDLQVKDFFAPPHAKSSLNTAAISPMVFNWQGKEMIAAGMRDGRIYLLDAKSPGGADHETALFTSAVMLKPGRNHDESGFHGAFSTWQNVDTQQRWIYAPFTGTPETNAAPVAEGKQPGTGGIAALQLAVANGQTVFSPLWLSAGMASPSPAVIANNMIFTLSHGQQPVLYALDALNGKELYSSGNAINGPVEAGGLALANGRVYFSTHDNTVYCFGLAQANLQLSEEE